MIASVTCCVSYPVWQRWQQIRKYQLHNVLRALRMKQNVTFVLLNLLFFCFCETMYKKCMDYFLLWLFVTDRWNTVYKLYSGRWWKGLDKTEFWLWLSPDVSFFSHFEEDVSFSIQVRANSEPYHFRTISEIAVCGKRGPFLMRAIWRCPQLRITCSVSCEDHMRVMGNNIKCGVSRHVRSR